MLLYIVGQSSLERASFQLVEIHELQTNWDSYSGKLGHISGKPGHTDCDYRSLIVGLYNKLTTQYKYKLFTVLTVGNNETREMHVIY